MSSVTKKRMNPTKMLVVNRKRLPIAAVTVIKETLIQILIQEEIMEEMETQILTLRMEIRTLFNYQRLQQPNQLVLNLVETKEQIFI